MSFYCYIIRSDQLDKFYIGSSFLDPEIRLKKHVNQYYGIKIFTAKADDWAIFLEILCTSMSQARKIEKHIKKMKSSNYIKNLIIYPDIIDKLLLRYTDNYK